MQEPLFENLDDYDIQKKEWEGMPEYNNINEPPPIIIATFKFKTENDFLKFKGLVQRYLYGGKKVFDGMQTAEVKNAWYPHKEKSNKYLYEDESEISDIHNK